MLALSVRTSKGLTELIFQPLMADSIPDVAGEASRRDWRFPADQRKINRLKGRSGLAALIVGGNTAIFIRVADKWISGLLAGLFQG